MNMSETNARIAEAALLLDKVRDIIATEIYAPTAEVMGLVEQIDNFLGFKTYAKEISAINAAIKNIENDPSFKHAINYDFNTLFAGKPKNWVGFQVDDYHGNLSFVLREIRAHLPDYRINVYDPPVNAHGYIAILSDPKKERGDYFCAHQNPSLAAILVAYRRLKDDYSER